MCGIAGLVDGSAGRVDLGAIAGRIRGSSLHRGPDDAWEPATLSADTTA